MKTNKQHNASISNDEGMEELQKHFINRSDQKDIIRIFQAFKTEAKILQNIQPGLFFEAKVLKRWKEQPATNFWSSFEFVPRFVIQAVYAVSILMTIVVFYGRRELQVTASNALVQVDETFILQNEFPTPTITTPDQAFQYALNINPEN